MASTGIRRRRAKPGATAQVGDVVDGVDAVEALHRKLQLITEPGVQRQRRRHAPLILQEHAELALLEASQCIAAIEVRPIRLQRRVGVDGGDPSGQRRIEIARAGQIRQQSEPGKFAAVNSVAAGSSVVSRPSVAGGTRLVVAAQFHVFVNVKPPEKLCRPLSQLSVSRTLQFMPLRELAAETTLNGDGVAPAIGRNAKLRPPTNRSGVIVDEK